jgi:hypothetical protein
MHIDNYDSILDVCTIVHVKVGQRWKKNLFHYSIEREKEKKEN